MRDLVARPGQAWDNRWVLTGPGTKEGPLADSALEVRALGEAGLAFCPGWRDTGRPRSSLSASPAVWSDQRLIAAPFAGRAENWAVSPAEHRDSFVQYLLSH